MAIRNTKGKGVKTLSAKELGIQVGLILGASALVLWGIFAGLSAYTHHNDYIKVPDVSGLSFDEAQIRLEQAGLRSQIMDSVYNEKARAYTIIEQNPKAQEMVKEDRRIYLVINTGNKPKIKAPNLVDMSLTLAKAVIKNRGLVLGQISMAYDPIGNNLVLAQQYKGQTLAEGTLIPKGSIINLTVASTDESQFAETDSTANSDSEMLEGEDLNP